MTTLSGRAALEVLPGGVLVIGRSRMRHEPGDATSLLTAYLTLVRKLRRQRRAAAIVLRRDDITELAAVLDRTAAEVIEQLGALMGATRSQRTAMATLFAAGALVIGLGTSAAASAHGTARPGGEVVRGPVATVPTEVTTVVAGDGLDPSVFASMPDDATSATAPGATGRPSATDVAPLVEQAREAAAALPDGSVTDTVGGPMSDRSATPAPAAPDTAPPTSAAPRSTASPVTTAAASGPSTTAPAAGLDGSATIPDTDPALVDIGSPPIPVRPSTTVPEVIEEPTLVVDPPAPGFGPGS